MSPSQKELIADELQRAWETCRNARHDLDGGFIRGANNRLYYAVFYAASALMLAYGVSTSKHTGVRAFVNKELVKKGHFPARMSSLYNDLFEQRTRGDYQLLAKLEPSLVAGQLPMVEDFVRHVERHLIELGYDWRPGHA